MIPLIPAFVQELRYKRNDTQKTVSPDRMNCPIYQDLSYGEILAGRPEAWLDNFFLCMHSNFKKDLILKFKIISRTYHSNVKFEMKP